jgi:signal transduction histidine kinase
LVIVEERQRIGREMHDGLAQTLGLLNVQIEMVKSAAKMEDWAAAEDELARLDSYLSNAYGDVRQALSDLRRTAMQGESFISGLRDYVQEFGVRNKLEAVLLTRNGDEPICLPALVEVHLQRVIQEALTNVRRHAEASQVIVRMHSSSEGWDVMVSDDGIGFDHDQLATTRGRYGLLTMQERVESVGGSFSIDSQPGAGTRIMVSVPCNSGNRG